METIRKRLTGKLIPAVPVPFTASGDLHRSAQESYVRYMAEQDVGGVAVWVHTGRGLYISEEMRAEVLSSWRRGLGQEKLIIAGAGSALTPEDPGFSFEAYAESALIMAKQGQALGSNALLVFPPTAFRGATDEDALIVRYHQALAGLDHPMVLFYLYHDAGGISYSTQVLDELMRIPQVVGIKMATLDSVMTYQDVAAFIRERHRKVVLITGEDRFLGYSLMLGARSALIGMGAALTEVQARLLNSCLDGDWAEFHRLNPLIDRLGQETFCPPMEKYIVRMLALLHIRGIIPRDAVNDILDFSITDAEMKELAVLAAELTRA